MTKKEKEDQINRDEKNQERARWKLNKVVKVGLSKVTFSENLKEIMELHMHLLGIKKLQVERRASTKVQR